MFTAVRPCTAGLAAASAGILTLSMVTAPPDAGVAISRAEVRAVVQLAAVTTADARTPVVTPLAAASTSSITPRSANAITPQASASLPSPETIFADLLANNWVRAALTTALASIWYLAFPITLPLSIFGAAAILKALSSSPLISSGPMSNVKALVAGIVLGTTVFAVVPALSVAGALGSLIAPLLPAPSTTAATTTMSSASASPSGSPALTRKGNRGIAGSPRTAMNARVRAADTTVGAQGRHRAAATSANAADAKSGGSKRLSTARSGR
ncbi:hypothetical protein [Mycolicibacterium sp.]|uniref:hypothetical protein n=1 Tax=Mycolicibacterium sp. TaxID=2320850 RepID=UPI0037C88129